MKSILPATPGQGNLVPVNGRYILEHLPVLEARNVGIYQVLRNAGGEFRAERLAPARARELAWADLEKRAFLVDKDWQKKLFAADDPFEEELEPLAELEPADRTELVAGLRSELAALQAGGAEPLMKARTIMNAVNQGFLANKAGLKGRPSEVTFHERALARETAAMVEVAVELARDQAVMAGLFDVFSELSNGQTLNHIARVFASYTGFQLFYAEQHQHRLVATLRRAFPSVYEERYRRLLPSLANAQAVSDQLLQLPPFDAFETREYALGAFLHDIGKMGNIDYFEGAEAYDPAQIQQHVFVGAGLILMNYGNDHDAARMMAGDHHNLLGQSDGYGLTRLEREQGRRAPVATTRVLAGRPEGFVSGEALGWLPTEMLAVADVYDAMTDPSRIYKKPMTPAQAVVFLEDTMAAEGRLDPVLVDLYIDFLRSQGAGVPADRGFKVKVSGRT